MLPVFDLSSVQLCVPRSDQKNSLHLGPVPSILCSTLSKLQLKRPEILIYIMDAAGFLRETMLMVAERNSRIGAQAVFRLDNSYVSQGSFRCILK